MKLSIDLDDTIADAEYNVMVGQVLREEIHNAVRKAVRSTVNEHKKAIGLAVDKTFKGLFDSNVIEDLVAKNMLTFLKEKSK